MECMMKLLDPVLITRRSVYDKNLNQMSVRMSLSGFGLMLSNRLGVVVLPRLIFCLSLILAIGHRMSGCKRFNA